MKNSLGDLNNHLFAEMERLSDEDLKGDDLEAEIKRSKAVTAVAGQIISNGHLLLKAMQFADDKWDAETTVPRMLQGGE
ncbi:MAG: hypothetical protein Q4B18_07885 [Bacillota bacterium]|nr:hypothetical protein [Bacillota bacterium]